MKTGKTLEIKVKEPFFAINDLYPAIDLMDIPNIINNIGEVSEDDLQEAINKIIVYMAKDRIDGMTINIDHRNECYAPTKEMTIAEIEKKLGYKVKIVKDKEE